MSVSLDQFIQACTNQRKAKAIEAGAKTMKDEARLVILAYAREHPDEFRVAGDSTTGRTFEFIQKGPGIIGGKVEIPGVKSVRVTYPESQPLPARFDDARSDECAAILDDLGPDAVDVLFEKHYAFRGPKAVVALSKARPDWAKQVAETLLPFTLPAKEGEKLSPRIDIS